MTNILVDVLPSTIEVEGKEYPIRTDFRDSLYVMLAFEDPELTAYEKYAVMYNNLLEDIPSHPQETLQQIQWFLNGGKVSSGENEDEDSTRLYSFSKDADLIFAAFRQTHGIDLQEVDMHWWKFLALFMDLGSETSFCNLIAMRKRYYAGTMSKEEKAAVREMGDMFEVPDTTPMSLEEREQEAEFLKLVEEQKRRQT